MSTRPVAASMRGVKLAVTPPWRMNVPSCTFRTRSTAGLNVTVSVIVDSRDAFATASGTVYGPPAVRNSCGAVMVICAADAAGIAGGVAGGGAVGSRGGGVAGVRRRGVGAGGGSGADRRRRRRACGGGVVGGAVASAATPVAGTGVPGAAAGTAASAS